jgi:hypothetical protein
MKVSLHTYLALAVLGLTAANVNVVGCGGGSSGSGGGSQADPCFDYAGYDGTMPATHFKADVLPIFRRSCGISDSCHGPDSTGHINLPSNQPYLGPPDGGKDPTQADIDMILDGIIGRSAEIPGTPDPKPEPDGFKMVDPSHPETSFLMWKIDAVFNSDGTSTFCKDLKCAGSNSCGDSMPQGGPELESGDKETIRRWIAQGAMND